ncbi:MAG TPA: response regulator [Anaerolineales bacterium]|jgi:CheY-like chemotaxis protein|nr:response regulator [Anaerolineales bacterium]
MPAKILIVDDDVDTLRLVGMMLETEGFDIIAAKSGMRAIELARSESPDLIILDVMMPELDGYAVTSQLRTDKTTRAIPILIFTAKTGHDDKMLGLELGADIYLTKPISTRELLSNVNQLLSPPEESVQVIPSQVPEGVVAVMAAKGGMGVSTVALNLGFSIYKHAAQRVIVADFRPGQGSLALELGYEREVSNNSLLDLPPEKINQQLIEEKLVEHSSGVTLLLSSPQLRDAKYISKTENFEIIANLLPQFAAYTIFDLAPGMTAINHKVLPICSEVVVIVEPSTQSVNQTKDLLEELSLLAIKSEQIRLLVFNRIHSSLQLSFGEVEEQLNLPICSSFSPNRELVNQASLEHAPFITLKPEGLTAQQINQLATSLIIQNE